MRTISKQGRAVGSRLNGASTYHDLQDGLKTTREVIVRHTIVAPLRLHTTKTRPLRRRCEEAHQHGKDDSLREASSPTRIGQRHRGVHVRNLAQLISRPHWLQGQDLVAHITKTEDLTATSLQLCPHAIQSAQHILVPVGEDQLWLGNLNTVDQCLGGEVGVDESRGGADGHETHPSANHVRGVEHEDGDKLARLDTLRQEPLGVLVDAGIGLMIGEAFGVGPDSLMGPFALDRLFEVVVNRDATGASYKADRCKSD